MPRDHPDLPEGVQLRTGADDWYEYAETLIERTPLTRQQANVIAMLHHGQQRKDIAAELDISPNTVDDHRAKALERLRDCQTATDLISDQFPDGFLPNHRTTQQGQVTLGDHEFEAKVSLYENHRAPESLDEFTTTFGTDGQTDGYIQFVLIEERQGDRITTLGEERQQLIRAYPNRDTLVWQGHSTRQFVGDGWASLVRHALAEAAQSAPDPAVVDDRLSQHRETSFERAQKAYKDVLRGTQTPEEAAETVMIPPERVHENVIALRQAAFWERVTKHYDAS